MGGKLTPTFVEKARITIEELQRNPKLKVKKLSDGDGLYLYIDISGSKWWIYRKRYQGREKTLSIGNFPEISLAHAREITLEYNTLISEGQDPAQVKKELRAMNAYGYNSSCFQFIAEEWFKNTKQDNADSYTNKITGRFNKYIFPAIGHMNVLGIRIEHLRKISDPLISKQLFEEARRNIGIIAQVFDYAINLRKTENNPARNLLKCLPSRRIKKHYAARTTPMHLKEGPSTDYYRQVNL